MSSKHSYGRYAYAYRLDNSTQHGGWKVDKIDVEEMDISMQLSQLGLYQILDLCPPQSARLSAGRGVQSLFGQCPNSFGIFFGGASLSQFHQATCFWK